MLAHRLVAAMAAAVLVLGAALASSTAATATPRTAANTSEARQAEPLPKRDVTSDVVNRGNKLYFKGKVSPGHANRAVWIQKKKCKKCDWKGFDKLTTNDASRYRVRVYAPRRGSWFWRAKVRAYGGYGTSYSQVWRTYFD